MIVFDLHCEAGHRFEGWFGSSNDFESQHERGLIACPDCGSGTVGKAPMAPAVPAKGTHRAPPPEQLSLPVQSARALADHEMPAQVQRAIEALADAQKEALANSTWVGDNFAEEARAMHYGERDAGPIHGRASLPEAKALLEEGVPVAPLPFPVAPPDEIN